MLRQLQTSRHLASTLALLSLLALAALLVARGKTVAQAAPAVVIASALPRPPEPWRRELAWTKVRADGEGFVQVLRDGGRVELTLDPRLQRMSERVLSSHPAPYASAVLLSVDDGRVLAMAGRSRAEPERSAADLALRAWAPAASIFKLVTAASLFEAGVGPDARVCYHDGVHSVEASNLASHPRLDKSCNTLSYGIAKSQNAILARLANDHLDAAALSHTARALGFGEALPFELPVAPSEAQVPHAGSLAFARVAAGFWSTTLSPLHGAWLAATLARGGVTPPLRLVDRVVDSDGGAHRPEAPAPRRVISEEAARAVARMMVGTTEWGTARTGFHERGSNRPLLPVAVAGKTGTLDRAQPYLAYSWFVGFAPAERPEVAVAVLLGNGEDWHVRAHQVAAELLANYFHGDGGEQLASR
jgi:cell division protein FtsI/penicillin-binding protein 2